MILFRLGVVSHTSILLSWVEIHVSLHRETKSTTSSTPTTSHGHKDHGIHRPLRCRFALANAPLRCNCLRYLWLVLEHHQLTWKHSFTDDIWPHDRFNSRSCMQHQAGDTPPSTTSNGSVHCAQYEEWSCRSVNSLGVLLWDRRVWLVKGLTTC